HTRFSRDWSSDVCSSDLRTLLLGAGGAARGVAAALLDAGILELAVVNRTPARADALVDALGQPDRAYSRYWDDLSNQGDFELIEIGRASGRGRVQCGSGR